jgi:hypothetical protein
VLSSMLSVREKAASTACKGEQHIKINKLVNQEDKKKNSCLESDSIPRAGL